jgi:hypothetical protein
LPATIRQWGHRALHMKIDTLEYVKKLEAAGVDRKQAEAHAQALRSVVVPDLTTKQDLRDLANELRAEIGHVRTDTWQIALAIVLATAILTTFLQRIL